jgi:nucleotide-binding universal stress UspA family protein
MTKRILVAIDGSTHAAKALSFAAGMAKAAGTELVLLHVVSNRPLSDDERRLAETEYGAALRRDTELSKLIQARDDSMVPAIFGRLRESEASARQSIGRRVLEDAADAARKAGAKVADLMVEAGDPAAQIVAAAQRLGVDHVVMGARGLGGFGSLVLGSVSQAVVHQVKCPCTIVK